MPVFKVQAPDGTVIKVEARDEATAIRGAQEHYASLQLGPRPANAVGMFDDLIPKGRDRQPAGPKPGMFDDLIPKGADRKPPGIAAGVSEAINRRGNEGLSAMASGASRLYREGLSAGGDRSEIPGALMEMVGGGWKALMAGPSGTFEGTVGRNVNALTNGEHPASGMGDFADNFLGLVAGPKGKAPAPASNYLTRPIPKPAPKPSAAAAVVDQFDRAGVQPSLAAVRGGFSAKAANFVAENPVGGNARRALAATRNQAKAKAGEIAAGYGANRGAQIAGENVQAGVQRFAKGGTDTLAGDGSAAAQATSFKAKSGALYDDAFRSLDAAMAGKTEPGGSLIEAPATVQALGQVRGATQSAAIGDLVRDPTLAKVADALETAQGARDMSFNDLRRLRTWVRDAKGNPELRASVGDANLSRLEGALTEDIYANAERLGSPLLASRLRRVDQFYAAGSQRIANALDAFANVSGGAPGESTYRRVWQSAQSGGQADAARLLSLKRSLRPEEWGDVVATAIADMGRPSKAAADALDPDAFSFNTFTTGYAGLSPRGRDVLFGAVGGGGKRATELKAELDNLAAVVARLKAVEKGANASGSGVSIQGAGTLGALGQIPFNPASAGPVLGGLASLRLTGAILTNPQAVRWLANLTRAKAAAEPAAFAKEVEKLQAAANRNAALVPLAESVRAIVATPAPIRSPALVGSAAAQEEPQP